MSWNYRVIKKNGKVGIYETHYNDKNQVVCFDKDPILGGFHYENKTQLVEQIHWLLHSLYKPELDYDMELANFDDTPDEGHK